MSNLNKITPRRLGEYYALDIVSGLTREELERFTAKTVGDIDVVEFQSRIKLKADAAPEPTPIPGPDAPDSFIRNSGYDVWLQLRGGATRKEIEKLLSMTEGDIRLTAPIGHEFYLVGQRVKPPTDDEELARMVGDRLKTVEARTATPEEQGGPTLEQWRDAYLELSLQLRAVKEARVMAVKDLARETQAKTAAYLSSKEHFPDLTKKQRRARREAALAEAPTLTMTVWAEFARRIENATSPFFYHQLGQLIRLANNLDTKLGR